MQSGTLQALRRCTPTQRFETRVTFYGKIVRTAGLGRLGWRIPPSMSAYSFLPAAFLCFCLLGRGHLSLTLSY